MNNEELHQRTILALARAACSPFMTADDISLLCHHCGVKVEDLQGVRVNGQSIGQQIIDMKRAA